MVMIKRSLIPIAILFMLSGCAVMQDQRAELIVAQRSFIAVVNSLVELRDADMFSEKEVENIGELIYLGDDLLDKWTESVLDGERPPRVISLFNDVLRMLFNYRVKENDSELRINYPSSKSRI